MSRFVTAGGIAGTRHPGGAPWQDLLGAAPTCDREIQLEDTGRVRAWLAREQIRDLVVVFTLTATTPSWP